MEYFEQVEQDFYEVYTQHLGQAALNSIPLSLMLESLKEWFGFGHQYGVKLNNEIIQEYLKILKQYGGHKSTCPSYHAYPAICNCGWENITKVVKL